MNARSLFIAVIVIIAAAAVFYAASCTRSVEGRLSYDPSNPPAEPPIGENQFTKTFPMSLHGTARGMQTWYEEEDGLGNLIDVDYNSVSCSSCHASKCIDCHSGEGPRAVSTCYKCHSRQAMESQVFGFTDVHFTAGMVCADCHNKTEIHGDGHVYGDMFEAKHLGYDCTSCHSFDSDDHDPLAGKSAAALEDDRMLSHSIPDTPPHQIHDGLVHCSSCHMQSSVTCYNCHFESLVTGDQKRQYKPFAGFVMLANSPIYGDGLVRPINYQAVVYGGKTFLAFGPFHGHTIMKEGRGCADCHNGPRIEELTETGKIVMSWWDEEEGELAHTTGVIPFVPDRFEFQFLEYDAGGDYWVPLSTKTNRTQYRYIEPLTDAQLRMLGYSGDVIE